MQYVLFKMNGWTIIHPIHIIQYYDIYRIRNYGNSNKAN